MEYLETLANPTNSEPNLDIVFVHGLNPTGEQDHARKTWIHENGTFWPETLLPQLLPTARVLLFAYNSSVLSNASNVTVAGHAQSLLNDVYNKRLDAQEAHRPLIFISHSLGGLLVKQALIEARLSERYRCLKASTHGLVFFATPHAGGNRASVADFASKICSVLTGEPTNSLLDTLKKDSLLNEISSDQFNYQVNDYEILSFYETRKMDVKIGRRKIFPQITSMYIVDRNAAKLGTNPLSLDRNHSEICKFSGSEDRVWERVGPNLKSMGINAQRGKVDCHHTRAEASTTNTLPSSSFLSSYIPFPRNRRFTGREMKLQDLEEELMIRQDCRKLALFGLGGVGKTQVALELVYIVKERWPAYLIFWVPAVSSESFEQAYRTIATRCAITLTPTEEDPKETVRQYLSGEMAGKWLLVVDNADDEEVLFGTPDSGRGVADYLPESKNGLTLFTTRYRQNAVALAGKKVVDIQHMTEVEAETFLRTSLTQEDLLQDRATTAELLSELAHLPLAIAQAAAYLNARPMSLQDYLSLIRNAEEDTISLLSREFRDETRYKSAGSVNNAVARTWLVSFNHIRRSDPIAADLLCFMAYIEHKEIPRRMLPEVKPVGHTEYALGTLSAYDFLNRQRDSKYYTMHRLVHLAIKVWLKEQGTTKDWYKKTISHLAEVFPSDNYSNLFTWREYFPHVFCLLKNTQGLDVEARYELCIWVGRCLRVDGRIREAVGWLLESFLWRQDHFPEDHPNRLASQYELARAYHANGQVKEAVKLLEHVVAIKKEVLAEDHPDRLASQHELARAYQANGQVKEAVKLLEHVVAIGKEVLAEDHPDQLASQHGLARAYQANGQVKEAVKLLEHVVAIEKGVLAEDHPDRLASQHELARAYQANGQVKEAVKLLEHVVAIRNGVLAEDHPNRLASQHGLAGAYQANGQVKEAVKLLEHVVAIRNGVLAEDHPDRLASQHGLAGAYQANGQVKEAVKLLEHVVAIRNGVLAEDHPDRLASQHELARAYQANGQVKEAVKLLEHVVAIEKGVLAEDHPDRLASQHELARAYQANGQVKEAVKLLEHVVAIKKGVLAEDHPDRLASQHELAGAYQANGQVKEAVKLLEHVVAIKKEVLAEDHPDRLASQHELARAYQANGQVKEAVKLLEHVVAIGKEVLAEDHPDQLASQHGLARAYQANGQVKEAVKLLEHVVAIRNGVLAEDHPNRLASQHGLAGAYQANGQVKEAVKLLEHVVAIRNGVLAEDHPDRLASQHELARAYQANGQVKEAVKLLEHVVVIEKGVLAEDHPDRLASQHELARAYQANGQVKEAVKLLEHVVAIEKGVLAEDHPDRLASQHELAGAYQANGQVKEAVKLLEHVVAIEKGVLAEDHPDRLASQHELAGAYQANGQVKEAVKLLEHVVAIRNGVLAEDHPNRLASQHGLAGAYQANGQVKEAVELLKHVMASNVGIE
ncbi:hypothetical protein ACLMJK_009417 [Lecanora helva]